jgi:Obg family GTPase CgtA-like protein
VLVVDLSSPDPAADLATLRDELAAYGSDLAERQTIVTGTKADLVDAPEAAARAIADGVIATSSVTGRGLDELLERLGLLARDAEAIEPDRAPYVVLRPGRPRFTVVREGKRWRITGRGVDRWVLETDLDDDRQVAKLQRRLQKEGVERALSSMGARRGDEIVIAERVFEFLPDDGGVRE